jgi:hypothetical protein
MISKQYLTLLENLEVYIFSFGENFKHFNNKPLDFIISDCNYFDCTHSSSKDFYNLLTQMDAITFGDQGMAMEGWMYFDCSAMPGSIVGLGIKQENIPDSLKDKIIIPRNYKGIIPVSMFIAIPMVGDNWFGHNLSSLKSLLGPSFSGLGLLTKATGVEVMKIKSMFGATQWGSPAIHIHSQLDDMELITSNTPVHTHENSFCYKSNYTTEKMIKALSGTKRISKEFDLMIDDLDLKSQLDLQGKIEKGERFFINSRPIHNNSKVTYSIKQLHL